MYKFTLFQQLSKETPLSPYNKLTDCSLLHSLLPDLPQLTETIKNPLDPNTNDSIFHLREEEYEKFKALYDKSSETVLVLKSWFLLWKEYIYGGQLPGKVLIVESIDTINRQKMNFYVKLSVNQFRFLKELYGFETLVEASSDIDIMKKSQKMSGFNEKNGFLTGLGDGEEILTLMDENFCKSTELKDSETETLPELCLKFLKKKIGIENPAFFSYLNAALQCLMSIPDIINFFLSLPSGPDIKEQSLTYHIYSIIYTILKSETKTIRPVEMWKEIRKVFSPTVRHDFFEFWRFLITSLDKENRNENIIREIFKGTLTDRRICRVCHKQSEKTEDFYDLSLEFCETLKKSVKKFSKAEKIDCVCENCSKKTKHFRIMMLKEAPKVLVLQIKSLLFKPQPDKIDEFCKFHKNFKLQTQTHEEKYSLISIAMQKGSSHYGSYTAYCKRYTKWYKFKDSKFYKIDLANILTKRAYCLVYEKQITNF